MGSLLGLPQFRIVLASVLLAISAAAIFALLVLIAPNGRDPHQPHAASHAARATRPPKHAAGTNVAVAPKSSAFALERAMTAGQLLNRWNDLTAEASQRFRVPQPWIRAVLAAESGGRTMSGENAPLTSSAGALGLMQLMPQTYEDMRAQHGLGSDPHSPHDNIFAGAAYLRALYLKYGYPAMFSAYNDGPGNLEERLRDGALLPVETRNYAGGITHALQTGTGLHGIRVKFTRPDGASIWIDSAAVVSVRAALVGEYASGVRTVITVGRMRQGVCESLARAKAILRAVNSRA